MSTEILEHSHDTSIQTRLKAPNMQTRTQSNQSQSRIIDNILENSESWKKVTLSPKHKVELKTKLKKVSPTASKNVLSNELLRNRDLSRKMPIIRKPNITY